MTPINLNRIHNGKDIIATVTTQDNKTIAIVLKPEDIATLREQLVDYYRKTGNITPNNDINVFNDFKRKKNSPQTLEGTIKISKKLYKDFQYLEVERKRLINLNTQLRHLNSNLRQENKALKNRLN